MFYFYKYKVRWYDPDSTEGKVIEESGIAIGKDYSDACANIVRLYDDNALAYIHLVCLSSDPGYVLFEEEMKVED